MKKTLYLALAATWFLGILPAHGNVSLKNGNFFVGYIDIVYPGGFEPKIERVYNSKTTYSGMFGWGWGNEYEVYLTVSADGSVVVHEFGGGAENRFNPASFKAEELDKAVALIRDVAAKNGTVAGGPAAIAYAKRLKTDASFRNEEWEKFRRLGKLQARQLPLGTKLFSNRFSFQVVTRTKDGYTRGFDNGKVETYDESGHLKKIADKNNNFIDLTYGKDGKLAKIVDNFNRRIYLTFNNKGRVEKIQGEDGKESSFKYNDEGELTYSKDTLGNVYTFKYSADRRRNMIEIGYSDKTTMQMAYWGRDKNENIKSVKDRDGTLTEYAYWTDAADKNHFSINVNIKGTEGKSLSESKYEYFIKNKADGEEWTYKMVTVLDGERTETIYNECCGAPLLIKRGAEETAFQYDPKGRVTKKITPTEVTDLAYDQSAGKVAKVVKYSKLNKKQNSWSEFKYDEKANLVLAKNSAGAGVRLFYDLNGRIKSMIDQNRRTIEFKYNENSKPIEITDRALGTITVSYKASGEIAKVDSQGGRKVAMQVTTAFQNLLDIIKPAGVTLSF